MKRHRKKSIRHQLQSSCQVGVAGEVVKDDSESVKTTPTFPLINVQVTKGDF